MDEQNQQQQQQSHANRRHTLFVILFASFIILTTFSMMMVSIGFNVNSQLTNYLTWANIFAAWTTKNDFKTIVSKFSWGKVGKYHSYLYSMPHS